MALRFRTRLNLTIASLVFLVVAVMTIVVLAIFVYDMTRMNWEFGRQLTELTNRNISSGITLSDEVEGYVQDQMVVEAFLAAEIAALAEAGGQSPEVVSDALRRVIRRSEEYKGAPLVGEFNVTDSSGRTVISTGDTPVDFNQGSEESPSPASEFLSLLTPDAPPVIQELSDPDNEGQRIKYVGVSGVEQPRIVQVGSSEAVAGSILDAFSEQNLVERYMLSDEFITVAVIDIDGNIIAEIGDTAEGSAVRQRVVRFCTGFLKSPPEEGFDVKILGQNVGVVTPLGTRDESKNLALFILHNSAGQVEFLTDRLGVLAVVGFILFVIAVVVGVFVSRGLSKPLVELARGAREFGNGNLNYRLRLRRKDEFNDLAQSFNTMAISIQEYMHELEQETSRRERFESEYRIAADVQSTLIPETAPEVPGLELSGFSQPSREVGGDFYDFIPIDEHRIALVVGDATGKGISAALLITQCASILGTLAGKMSEPSRLLEATNDAFFQRIGVTHRFVTLAYAIIDTQAKTLSYSSAGHPPPLMINSSDHEARWLSCKSGFPLGIVRDAEYDEVTISYRPGDTLLLYSDGLSEAHDPNDELYGDDRIQESFARHVTEPLDTIVVRLREDVESHMNGREAIDDLTFVVARFLS